MSTKDFFIDQDALTAAKILFYQKYLAHYLPKVLIQYGKCCIADFFCGCGKNGDKDGSPLVLLNVAENILASPIIKRERPNAVVYVVFSDENRKYCDNLEIILKQRVKQEKIKILGPFCKDFSSVSEDTVKALSKAGMPTFFFLDPFTYSVIEIDEIKMLIDLPRTEVLLFLPTSHSYRFVSEAQATPKLKKFLESFTESGCCDYADIDDFNESIENRFRSYMGLKYVRAVRLDDGSRKNALFYLTKHLVGMQGMNKLVWKYADNGQTVDVKRNVAQDLLFDVGPMTGKYRVLEEKFKNFLKEKKQLFNTDIIDYVAQIGFLSKYAQKILKQMQDEGVIEVKYLSSKKTGFYIGDDNWNEKLAVIKYKG